MTWLIQLHVRLLETMHRNVEIHSRWKHHAVILIDKTVNDIAGKKAVLCDVTCAHTWWLTWEHISKQILLEIDEMTKLLERSGTRVTWDGTWDKSLLMTQVTYDLHCLRHALFEKPCNHWRKITKMFKIRKNLM